MGHCLYFIYSCCCLLKVTGNYVAEKFSKETNGVSANLLAGLFERKYIDTIEHYQQSHSHHFLLLYSMSC